MLIQFYDVAGVFVYCAIGTAIILVRSIDMIIGIQGEARRRKWKGSISTSTARPSTLKSSPHFPQLKGAFGLLFFGPGRGCGGMTDRTAPATLHRLASWLICRGIPSGASRPLGACPIRRPSSAWRTHSLEGVEPQSFAIGNKTVALTVGEPQDVPPAFIAETIHAHARDFGRYPPIAGTPKFRAAVAAWLSRRFNLPGSAIDADKQILPLNGSREGLFFAIPPLTPDSKGGGRPVVLIPNPFYVTYPAAVLAAGAEPYYVPSRAKTGLACPISRPCPKLFSSARSLLFFARRQTPKAPAPRPPIGGCCSNSPTLTISLCWRMNAIVRSMSPHLQSVQPRCATP